MRLAPHWVRILLAAAAMELPVRIGAQSAVPDSVVYALSPASWFDVLTGKAGLLSLVGHEHRIRARAFSGRIVYYPRALATSHIELVVLSDSLQVLTPP